MKDKISVIVPCYNVQKYVMRCFESIYNQTYGFENLEVIFIDDFSTDNTYTIIDSLQKRYIKNVLSAKLEKKGLAGGARNAGLDMATGKYITFVDADDCIHPKMIEILYNKIIEEDYNVVQCLAKRFSSENADYSTMDGNSKVLLQLNNIEDRKRLILRCTGGGNDMCVWTKLYTKSFLNNNKIRFLENVYFEDNHFSLMCILLAKKYCIIDSTLLYYFDNKEGITNTTSSLDKVRDLPKVGKAIFSEISQRKIGTECYYEIQALIIWKAYFEALDRLEMTFLHERKFYAESILRVWGKQEILNSPYVTSITQETLLKNLEYIKENDK